MTKFIGCEIPQYYVEGDHEAIIETFRLIRDTVFDTSALEREREELTDDLNAVAGLIQDGIRQNARVARDQSDYNREYERLAARYEKAKRRLDGAGGGNQGINT